MNRNLILAFILLATLFMVNAVPLQFGVTFNPCPLQGVDSLVVGINPSPPIAGRHEEVDVTGKLSRDIVADTTILGIGFTDVNKKSLIKPYVQTFAEPVKAGSPFEIKAGRVPTPRRLPDTYLILTVVGDPTGDPKNPVDVIGCEYAVVSKTSPPPALNTTDFAAFPDLIY